ncbi:hypothetical protein HELRODRAFT_166807 [Helobdella robusta]|uniref:Ankyrin UPA domain-containing protein n=1 Tax=Helobdella robusta TaxID=6412 RepID=T1EYJ9_HELRO|nr:hypothetical protein HELRODRAFT_166807 [Helobdella robusta]ESO11770.1 hypothetical protein HELRODRAFT_166807 [Helobdella robusta]
MTSENFDSTLLKNVYDEMCLVPYISELKLSVTRTSLNRGVLKVFCSLYNKNLKASEAETETKEFIIIPDIEVFAGKKYYLNMEGNILIYTNVENENDHLVFKPFRENYLVKSLFVKNSLDAPKGLLQILCGYVEKTMVYSTDIYLPETNIRCLNDEFCNVRNFLQMIFEKKKVQISLDEYTLSDNVLGEKQILKKLWTNNFTDTIEVDVNIKEKPIDCIEVCEIFSDVTECNVYAISRSVIKKTIVIAKEKCIDPRLIIANLFQIKDKEYKYEINSKVEEYKTLDDGTLEIRKNLIKKRYLDNDEKNEVEEIIQIKDELNLGSVIHLDVKIENTHLVFEPHNFRNKFTRKVIIKPKTIGKSVLECRLYRLKTERNEKQFIYDDKQTFSLVTVVLKKFIPNIDLGDFELFSKKSDGNIIFRKVVQNPKNLHIFVENIVELNVHDLSYSDVVAVTRFYKIRENIEDDSCVKLEIYKTILRPKTQLSAEPIQDQLAKEFQLIDVPSYVIQESEPQRKELSDGSIAFSRCFKKKTGITDTQADIIEEIIEIAPGFDETSADKIHVETESSEVEEAIGPNRFAKKLVRKTVLKPMVESDENAVALPIGNIESLSSELVFLQKVIPNIDLRDFEIGTSKPDGSKVFKKVVQNPDKPDVFVENIVETNVPGLSDDDVEVVTRVYKIRENLNDHGCVKREINKKTVKPKKQLSAVPIQDHSEVEEAIGPNRFAKKLVRKTVLKPMVESDENAVALPIGNIESLSSELVFLQKVIPNIDLRDFEIGTSKPDGSKVFKKVVQNPDKPDVFVENIVETNVPGLSDDDVEVVTRVYKIRENLKDDGCVKREINKKTVKPKKQLSAEPIQDQLAKEFQLIDVPSYVIQESEPQRKELSDGSIAFSRCFKKKTGITDTQADIIEEIIEIAPGFDETSADKIHVETESSEVEEAIGPNRFAKKLVRKTVLKPMVESDENAVALPIGNIESLSSELVFLQKVIPNIDLRDFEIGTSKPDGSKVFKKVVQNPDKPDVFVENIVETNVPGLSDDDVEVVTRVYKIRENLNDDGCVKREINKKTVKPKKQLSAEPIQDQLAKEFQLIDVPSYVIQESEPQRKELSDGSIAFSRCFKKKTGITDTQADIIEEIIEIAPGFDETSADKIHVETESSEVEEAIGPNRFAKKLVRKTVLKPMVESDENAVALPIGNIESLSSELVFLQKVIPNIDLRDFEIGTSKPDGSKVFKKVVQNPDKPDVFVENIVETNVPGLSDDDVEVVTRVYKIRENLKDDGCVKREINKKTVKPKKQLFAEPIQDQLAKEFQLIDVPSYVIQEIEPQRKELSDGSVAFRKFFKKNPCLKDSQADIIEELIVIAPGFNNASVGKVHVETETCQVDEPHGQNLMLKKLVKKTVLKPMFDADEKVISLLDDYSGIRNLFVSTDQFFPQTSPSFDSMVLRQYDTIVDETAVIRPMFDSSFQKNLCTFLTDDFETDEQWSVINNVSHHDKRLNKFRTAMKRTIGPDGEIIEQLITEDYFSDISNSSSKSSSLDSLIFTGEVENSNNNFHPITVFTNTIEEDPILETETSEYEDTLPDGTFVCRKIVKTNKKQTVIKRVILEGVGEDEPFPELSDGGLVPCYSNNQHFTRYFDHSSTDPEISTDVQVNEERLENGAHVRRRVTNTKQQLLTTERLVVGGKGLFNSNEESEDAVLNSLKSLSLTKTSTVNEICTIFFRKTQK